MSTVHANTPHDALRRLASLVASAGTGIPHEIVLDLIASAIDVVVQVARTADGARRVAAVAEVRGPETVRTIWGRP
jgi:pilus assembly protein CpaF